jgi:MoaA/NifB/PqqE/SkfB family radical SAM enzyme
MLDYPLFNVSWILGRFCNYKCSYCWPYANTDKPDHQEFEIYTRTIDSIKSQARQNGFNRFHFSFSGGEPTAYKRLLDLIEYYAEDDSPYQSIHMTTNLSPNETWWLRYIDKTKQLSHKSLTASYHAEHADETEFGDKCLFLMENNINVTVNQVMVPALFDEYYERCQRLWDRGINVTLKPQSNETASRIVDGYTEEQIEKLMAQFPNRYIDGKQLMQVRLEDAKGNDYGIDQAERMNAFGFNKFKGWSCNAGYQSCVIRGNEVKRAYSCSEQPIGTLTEGFKLFDSPRPCVTETCVSSADSKIPKVKI